ncbi:hypothetical protein GCM10010493_35260 [Streptomyces lavendulae subsp. grasserius]
MTALPSPDRRDAASSGTAVPVGGPRAFASMNVAVTGATGFIGGHLGALLTGWGAQVTALMREGSGETRGGGPRYAV